MGIGYIVHNHIISTNILNTREICSFVLLLLLLLDQIYILFSQTLLLLIIINKYYFKMRKLQKQHINIIQTCISKVKLSSLINDVY